MSIDLRTWYPPDKRPSAVSIFLVHAPVTFGDSQLTITFAQNAIAEEERFVCASHFIKHAIVAFKTVLPRVLDQKNFGLLRMVTLTSGNYVKTLVLRSSASEESNKYKVHLVPFFESHQEQCRLQYYRTHGKYKDGGLLSWIGRRETIVDKWMENDGIEFGEGGLNKIAITKFKLGSLANRLKKVAMAQTPPIIK